MTTVQRHERISGTNLSGSDAAQNRTYILQYAPYAAGSMVIYAQGAYLYETNDFTISNGTITFLNQVFNADIIKLDYETTTTTPSTSLRYAQTTDLADAIGIIGYIPSRTVGSTSMDNETLVGTPTVSASTTYFLAQQNLLAGTYTLYTGGVTSPTATTALTETTHYTLDLRTGAVRFTAAGVTLIGTNYVYATYQYCTVNVTDQKLSNALARAQTELDDAAQTSWTDGSVANPDYPSVVEYQPSKGRYDRNYFVYKKRPIIDVTSVLLSNMTSSQTTIPLTVGDGDLFPISGTIVIDNEIIVYNGVSSDTLQSCTRAQNGTAAVAHTAGAVISTTILEVSATYEGSQPVYQALRPGVEMSVDEDIGKVYIFDNQIIGGIYVQDLIHVRPDVPDRIRITYLGGHNTLPAHITRATIIIAKQILAQDNILGSMIKGRNEFKPEMLQADASELTRILRNVALSLHGNT